MSEEALRLWDLRHQRIQMLHLSWLAFFISFVIWFAHAPLMIYIKESLALNDHQVKTLLLLNVALTIPARSLIGMFVDKFGPRVIYSLLLLIGGLLCFGFALAPNYETLAAFRFLLGFVGASFVVGIRLIAEWFPARQLGLAEGIYGGWGNFGAAVGALVLPLIASFFALPLGWRVAVALAGTIAIIYAWFFYRFARDTPAGATYFKPNRIGALEVSSRKDLVLYIATSSVLYLAIALLLWKLSAPPTPLLPLPVALAIGAGFLLLYALQVRKMFSVNQHLFAPVQTPPPVQYAFKQVTILSIAYLAAFGAELAVVSMLPLYFHDTFGWSPMLAAALASSFAFMNLIARPLGGWFSDKFGRKNVLTLVMVGITLGFLGFAHIEASWPMLAVIGLTVVASFFVQAGCGAVFACVPLIQRRLTGQFAGIAGAYGNVGGLVFLTMLALYGPSFFFVFIASTAALSLLAVQWYSEPKGHLIEVMPDGSIQLIAVE
ncbi:MFS transporter [Permianibacter aggregans]|uniref:NNP family nitrate/nitrite transporter-like MFS transporter n=1 Tax=Permianibacter aggregans TaxID=1510150 RepID=A0A4R6UQ50_9GAMM|nr:MFS transporter [Permianibacter aggregans]QGX39164.1 MFS transporter [Permianibacter aggregans]TDQ47623.1 NNP family nitrate/nitrite transporter-like MFS transporter [Permianibacter aggregans]